MSLHIQYHDAPPLPGTRCIKCNNVFRVAPYVSILQGPICGYCCVKFDIDLKKASPWAGASKPRKSHVVESFVTKPKPKHTC